VRPFRQSLHQSRYERVAGYVGDGRLDIAAGRNYYLAPNWTKHTDYCDGAATNGPDVDDNYEGTMDGPDAESRLNALRGVALEVGATLNQVVIAWMLKGEPPVLPIIAGSRTEQVRENLGAVGFEFSADQMERLNTAGNPSVKKAWLR
jgi:aryl-alcohol dehydrogenase-like predicted oxidoreductase